MGKKNYKGVDIEMLLLVRFEPLNYNSNKFVKL